ncbi:MAG: tRNA uridine-5-carboxymethylaminomethyl(34) synthesis enzyme MnmG [Bacteroidales bacterium]|nr:tRNA uridine-5-carboxymethylaminomethyl(34) synthesis enzyme MnmG [Bacteroidales bacterium]MDD4821134.1 tRNA uridine-5-carboxymethylaminomethyl(34) synthesis enzyme MnmG [Bacteroidales bacterium]
MVFKYDVIVVGAGHAGCEAAAAAANLGSKTLLITMDMNRIAQMSCNPAVGGIAKGQIVREIDALGGFMGIVTDRSSLQFRMLNRSKGPAMWSPRSQCDVNRFIQEWRHVLDHTDRLAIWQDTVTSLIIDKNSVQGVRTSLGLEFFAPSVVLTNGTFLNGIMHFGRTQLPGGRIAESSSYGLSDQLKEAGLSVQRMKTGTPARIDIRSVDLDLMERQDGEEYAHGFSFLPEIASPLKQLPCYTTSTNSDVHDILRSSLAESPLYNGQIKSIGPRYCPSVETKIITFADKQSHPLFLEPESENSNVYYLNGFSSSLPIEIQWNALKKIPAFRDVRLYRPGYAIEYDFFDPTQLCTNLESKLISGLFLAGQVNGTTGYEEAGGQGLMAGINAHMHTHGGESFVLGRDEAYIGVLIDDLITKGVDEPYRMFTSRAEYRILLRQDDADRRLSAKSFGIGLASSERNSLLIEKEAWINRIVEFVRSYSVRPDLVNGFLESIGDTPLKQGVKLHSLVLRPMLSISALSNTIPALASLLNEIPDRKEEIIEASEIELKYEGYIERERLIADRVNRLEHIRIRGKINYRDIQALSTEARQKLEKINPETLAQAGRIPGISPSDINILLVLMGR